MTEALRQIVAEEGRFIPAGEKQQAILFSKIPAEFSGFTDLKLTWVDLDEGKIRLILGEELHPKIDFKKNRYREGIIVSEGNKLVAALVKSQSLSADPSIPYYSLSLFSLHTDGSQLIVNDPVTGTEFVENNNYGPGGYLLNYLSDTIKHSDKHLGFIRFTKADGHAYLVSPVLHEPMIILNGEGKPPIISVAAGI